MKHDALFGLFVFAAVMTLAETARAQPRPNAIPDSNGAGFDTHLFRPALDSRGLVSINGVDVLGDGRFSLGLVGDYGRGILRVPDVGQKSTTLIDHSFQGTFHFAYGIANRASVGISAPVVLMKGEEQFTSAGASAVAGWGPQALDVQAFSHVAFHAKVKLLRADSSANGVGVALAGQVGIPVSDAPKNGGADPTLWYWPMVIVEKRFGTGNPIRLAANLGWRGHSPSSTTLGLRDGTFRDGSRITYGIGGSVRVLDPLDLVVETYGTYLLSDSAGPVRPSNEALAGIKLFVDDSSYLVVGGGPRYTNGFEAADVRGVVGFIFEPPAKDSDGDGLRDDVDRCPNTPGLFANEGCPLDSDGDGIPDVEDACPFVKGPRTDNPRTNGCPPDRDGDGIPDSVDACPDVPGIATNDPKTNGCPPPDDRDHDGIGDAEDACPDLPGKRHSDPKRNGCPDVFLDDKSGVITVFEKILFKTASAEILPESNKILDDVAKVLEEHPELTLIEVAGHADERGGEQYNLQLTQARVESVVAALIARKIDRSRVRAKGYGFYCPIEEGHDEAAWQKNRRVEFKVVKTNNKALEDIQLGCANATAHGVKPAPVP
jgi:OmpA-OmpF porin, OOP family